jgi:predicted amidohydrolase YtcJ
MRCSGRVAVGRFAASRVKVMQDGSRRTSPRAMHSPLTAYTAGSPWTSGLQGCGAIRPGMLADLAVLDRDPFDGPTSEIAATGVALTYVGGERVHTAPDA